MTHICVRKLITICSDNGLSPGWRQAIILTNAMILLIGPLGTNFSEILIEIPASSLKNAFKNVVWKIAVILLGLNVLTHRDLVKLIYVNELLHYCFRFAPISLQASTWTNGKYFPWQSKIRKHSCKNALKKSGILSGLKVHVLNAAIQSEIYCQLFKSIWQYSLVSLTHNAISLALFCHRWYTKNTKKAIVSFKWR